MTANNGALADPGRISEKLPMFGHYLPMLSISIPASDIYFFISGLI
jgi:hypothetical protein